MKNSSSPANRTAASTADQLRQPMVDAIYKPCQRPQRHRRAGPATFQGDSLPGDTRRNFENFPLRDVVNDTKSPGYCGPTAVAAITGAPISLVRDCYRFVRFGPNWAERRMATPIAGTYWDEIPHVLRLLGFRGFWQKIEGLPTFAAFMESRAGRLRTHPCVVLVTDHAVAVSGWQFCDTKTNGKVVEADEAPGRRCRVRNAFVITGRIPPQIEIPRKAVSVAEANAAVG